MTLNPHIAVPVEFKERDGRTLTGRDWPTLVEAILRYRQGHGWPTGEPMREIVAQVCVNYPHACRLDYPQPGAVPSASDPQRAPHKRAARWAERLMQNPPAMVSDSEAQRAADICRQCPMAVDVSGTCKGCDQTLGRVRGALLPRLPDRIGPLCCKHLGEFLPISIYAAQPAVKEAPAYCWRLRNRK
jgi:hypothetical protein